jgi:hypothetical protein
MLLLADLVHAGSNRGNIIISQTLAVLAAAAGVQAAPAEAVGDVCYAGRRKVLSLLQRLPGEAALQTAWGWCACMPADELLRAVLLMSSCLLNGQQ